MLPVEASQHETDSRSRWMIISTLWLTLMLTLDRLIRREIKKVHFDIPAYPGLTRQVEVRGGERR